MELGQPARVPCSKRNYLHVSGYNLELAESLNDKNRFLPTSFSVQLLFSLSFMVTSLCIRGDFHGEVSIDCGNVKNCDWDFKEL